MLLASDNFRRANSGDLGANWQAQTSDPLAIESDAARCNTTSEATDQAESYTGVTWPDDQYSEVVLGTVGTAASDIGMGPTCRNSTTAGVATYYRLIPNSLGWGLRRFVAGVDTLLDSDTGTTFTANDVVRLEVRTNGANCDWVAKKNGVQFASGTDTSPLTSGRPGIAYSSVDAPSRILSWSGGNLDSTSPGPDNTNWHDGASGTTVTVPLSATAGTVITVDIALDMSGGRDVTGVTYDGNALTEVQEANLSGAGVGAGVASYIGIAGADGTLNDVVVTFDAELGGAYAGVVATSWQGIENASVAAAHRTIYDEGDSGGGGGGINVTVVDSIAGDIVKSFNHSGIATTLAPVETIVGEVHINRLGTAFDWGLQYKIATGASTVMAWTGDDFCTHVAFALVPAPEDEEVDLFNIPGRRIFVLP